MRDVNWWLMALAFVLGLLLTFAMMIRRVTREVPVTHMVSAGVKAPHLGKPDIKADLGKVGGAVSAAGASAAAGVSAKLSDAAGKVGETTDKVIDTVGGKIDEAGDALDATARKAGGALDSAAARIDAKLDAADDKLAAAAAKADAKMDEVSGATAAKFASIEDVAAGPYGKGSAKAGDGGSGPTGWLIKGNADSMLFHGPDSPAYEQTIAEVWFFDEDTARAAGFDRWDKNST
jgi:hypothetical protein